MKSKSKETEQKVYVRKRDEGGRETEMEKANIFIVFSPVLF